MNRTTLQQISRLRRKEAATLLKGGHFEGAFYLIGYAVECALKACVAKQVRRYDFPDKALAQQVHTHNLERLVKAAGLEPELRSDLNKDPDLKLNWAVAKDWSEVARYETGISAAQAKDLYAACTARKGGVLAWVRKRW